MAEELDELAAAYAAETRLSQQVCLDLLAADLEPPPRWRVDELGYGTREVAAILAGQKNRHRADEEEVW